MDDRMWDALVESTRQVHAQLMRETGTVIPPTLFALAGGRLLGYVRLRPVHVGQDALAGIAEMSYLAAAAQADEVVAAWETQDLAVACDHVPLHPDSALNIVEARPDQHVVHRFPYRERRLPGRTEHGMLRCEPDWLTPASPARDGELEPAIAVLLQYCWEPFDTGADIVIGSAAAWLEEQGYTIGLVAPAQNEHPPG